MGASVEGGCRRSARESGRTVMGREGKEPLLQLPTSPAVAVAALPSAHPRVRCHAGCMSWPLQMLLPRLDSASVGSTSAAWRSSVCHQLPQGALCSHLFVELRRYRNTHIFLQMRERQKQGQDSCANDDVPSLVCRLFDAAQNNTGPSPLPCVQLSIFMVITSAVVEHLDSQN